MLSRLKGAAIGWSELMDRDEVVGWGIGVHSC